jgi:hypothetical protein
MKKGVKRGQLKISFGMIFSIILIIIFLSFAFYAIMKIIGFQQNAQIGMFVNDLQEDIDNLWNSESGSFDREYVISKKVESVCFEKNAKNIFFMPAGVGGSFDYYEIEHVQLFNGFCVKNEKGKIIINLEKNFGESLVSINEIRG